MTTHIVIPARLESTRLPAKVLAEIGGLPMVVRTYRQAMQVGADTVVIATDSESVFAVCEAHEAAVIMTDPSHPSGTTRLAEVADHFSWESSDIIIGMQADEPLLPPATVFHLIEVFSKQSSSPMASVYDVIADPQELMNPNVVKVVLNAENQAVYFSRAPIPWHRDAFANKESLDTCPVEYYRHIGLYAYRVDFLKRYIAWDESPLEKIECLEQLRVLYHGESIVMARTAEPVPPGIDTQEDLDYVRGLMGS